MTRFSKYNFSLIKLNLKMDRKVAYALNTHKYSAGAVPVSGIGYDVFRLGYKCLSHAIILLLRITIIKKIAITCNYNYNLLF